MVPLVGWRLCTGPVALLGGCGMILLACLRLLAGPAGWLVVVELWCCGVGWLWNGPGRLLAVVESSWRLVGGCGTALWFGWRLCIGPAVLVACVEWSCLVCWRLLHGLAVLVPLA